MINPLLQCKAGVYTCSFPHRLCVISSHSATGIQIDICCTRKRRAFSRAGAPDPTTHQLGRGGKKQKRRRLCNRQQQNKSLIEKTHVAMTHTHPPNTNMITRKMSARVRNEQKKEGKGLPAFNLACIQVPPTKKTNAKSPTIRERLCKKTMTQVCFSTQKLSKTLLT